MGTRLNFLLYHCVQACDTLGAPAAAAVVNYVRRKVCMVFGYSSGVKKMLFSLMIKRNFKPDKTHG